MNQYLSPEEEARQKKRDEDQARYQAQVSIAEALTKLIMSREKEIAIADLARNWVNADQGRDSAIRSLNARMKRLEEQGKSIEAIFNKEVRKMRNDLSAKFTELEKEHRMLMKKVLEHEGN